MLHGIVFAFFSAAFADPRFCYRAGGATEESLFAAGDFFSFIFEYFSELLPFAFADPSYGCRRPIPPVDGFWLTAGAADPGYGMTWPLDLVSSGGLLVGNFAGDAIVNFRDFSFRCRRRTIFREL